jgi:hypothetical protein
VTMTDKRKPCHNIDYEKRFNTEEARPGHKHRRTISITSEELIKTIGAATPPLGKSGPINPAELRTRLTETRAKALIISEEENHIRNIIAMRKHFSSKSISKSEPSKSPLYDACMGDKKGDLRGSFNSNTTEITVSEENGVNRVMEILECLSLDRREFETYRERVRELLEKSPETHFSLILDDERSVKGVFYVEGGSGYMHRILASNELPLVIAPRKVKSYFLFDNKQKNFTTASSEKFEAVLLNTL